VGNKRNKCCCGDCLLGEDDFNRPDANPPTGRWHVVSGEWEIENEELNCVEEGILATTICHPSNYPNGSFVATVKLIGMSNGSVSAWEVGVGKPDSPKYVVEVLHNPMTLQATLKLWSGNKGSVLHEETYFGVNSNATLTVCYAPGLAIDVEIGRIPAIEWCDDNNGEPCYVIGGVAVGNFSFRVGRFDDWRYEAHWLDDPTCPKCPCFCEKSREDFGCYPDVLYLSFISVGADSATLSTIPLYQSFLNPLSYLWPEKVTWYSEVQGCGSPVGAQWTAKFTCGQEDLGALAFGTADYNFEEPSSAQIVFVWVGVDSAIAAWTPRNAIKEDSTCDPIELTFPEVKVNSAFPSPICFDPPCDTTGCYTPYCTDRNNECFISEPDIRFIPKITA
jgi:hypothetical protein